MVYLIYIYLRLEHHVTIQICYEQLDVLVLFMP
jgi:hypothetical protein